MKKNKCILNNEKGIITISFLFVLVICLMFLLSFFGLCLTLATGSITQYITYSTARKLSLSDKSLDEQKSQATQQYQTLKSKFFNNTGEWFDLPESPQLGMNEEYNDENYRKMFYGAYISFSSTLSNFKIPLLSDKEGGDLKTLIGSYLGREPSQQECEKFNEERLSKLCDLYGEISSCSSIVSVSADNGC